MKADLILAMLLVGSSPAWMIAADAPDTPEPKTNMKEALRARVAEDARKKPAPAVAAAAAKPTAPLSESVAKPADTTPSTGAIPDADERKTETNPSIAKAPATVLPKVEVKKGRITVLDQKLAQQEQEIARERKNLKTSEVDSALNDAKIAKPLAIFGGDSAQFRKRIASERVELMEAEKDLIEAIAYAKTKEEKAELQKQLDELKTMRRQLDKSLR